MRQQILKILLLWQFQKKKNLDSLWLVQLFDCFEFSKRIGRTVTELECEFCVVCVFVCDTHGMSTISLQNHLGHLPSNSGWSDKSMPKGAFSDCSHGDAAENRIPRPLHIKYKLNSRYSRWVFKEATLLYAIQGQSPPTRWPLQATVSWRMLPLSPPVLLCLVFVLHHCSLQHSSSCTPIFEDDSGMEEKVDQRKMVAMSICLGKWYPNLLGPERSPQPLPSWNLLKYWNPRWWCPNFVRSHDI